MKNPIQPLAMDSHNVLRFKKNAIVDHMLNVCQKHGCSLNDLACMEFSNDDRSQLAQLIGYSLSGYGELGYVGNDAYCVAEKMAKENKSEVEARIEYLEEELAEVRKSLCEPVARLFGIHPDDLKRNGETE